MHKKRKTSGIHASSRKPTKQCAMKMKQRNKKKRWAPKIFLMEGRSLAIRRMQKTCAIDIKQLQVDDYSYIDSTSYLFSK